MAVLWLIVAATLDLGRAFSAGHILQSAARTTTRALALVELPAVETFEVALSGLFDEDFLVMDLDCLAAMAPTGQTPEQYHASLLAGLTLNQMLRSLMIYERVTVNGREQNLLRYPGALLRRSGSPVSGKPCTTGMVVGVPEVDSAASRIVIHPVVEEVVAGDFSAAGSGSGSVGLRIRYPFQAAAFSNWRIVDGVRRLESANETNGFAVDLRTKNPTDAQQSELDARGPDGGLQAYAARGNGDPIPVYGGSDGLGVQGVLGREVRPYRRVLQAQAFAPREIVAGSGT